MKALIKISGNYADEFNTETLQVVELEDLNHVNLIKLWLNKHGEGEEFGFGTNEEIRGEDIEIDVDELHLHELEFAEKICGSYGFGCGVKWDSLTEKVREWMEDEHDYKDPTTEKEWSDMWKLNHMDGSQDKEEARLQAINDAHFYKTLEELVK